MPVLFANDFKDTTSTFAGISANYDFDANALTNSFIAKFYRNEFIDNETKSDILGKTHNTNLIGAEANFGIFAGVKFDSLVKKHKVWFL